MNTQKWAPGSWFATRQGFSTVYVEAHAGGGLIQEVAACGPTQDHEQQEANARLIAAAPDMYEALKDLVDDICDREDVDSPSCNPGRKSAVKWARAALAKAGVA